MREELLTVIEKNSRIDLKELAVILGVQEVDVVNELAALEADCAAASADSFAPST